MLACAGVIFVSDSSGVGEARRRARLASEETSLDEAARERAAIIATELATNLVRYTKGGEILLRSGTNGREEWLDIFSIDRGPGMKNVAQSLEDGHSTGGGSGTGLGAVRRLSTEFDIDSRAPAGTVVFSRVADRQVQKAAPGSFVWGALSRPAPHETVCGDACRIAEGPKGLSIMVADGLGHGVEAARAAEEAADVFEGDPFAPLAMLMDRANVRMRGTRGGALAAARIDSAARSLQYVGVGNIYGYLHSMGKEAGHGMVSHNGIVGHQMRKVSQFDYPCPEQSLLIMHSDGLQNRWSLDSYTGLVCRHPGVVAGVLYRDFARGRDDATVVVARLSLPEVA